MMGIGSNSQVLGTDHELSASMGSSPYLCSESFVRLFAFLALIVLLSKRGPASICLPSGPARVPSHAVSR